MGGTGGAVGLTLRTGLDTKSLAGDFGGIGGLFLLNLVLLLFCAVTGGLMKSGKKLGFTSGISGRGGKGPLISEGYEYEL